jgi:large subunit ribosomal protein L3
MAASLGILGKKLGMTQVFSEEGVVTGVTAVEVGPCVVVQKRTEEKDGYYALQLGFEDKPERKAKRPETGHFAKAGCPPKRVLREYRVSKEIVDQFEVGQEISAAMFSEGDVVDVTGLSRGKGFTGVMKRYGFHGAKDTHGVHECFRHGGSLGMNMTPGHVIKGKKMPGHQGNSRVTVQNVRIVRVFPEKNIVYFKGPVPGGPTTILSIRPAVKKSK